ncbi:S-layer homology domain-containing protein [Paenibacillus sp. MMS20-IR301]|uniref:S-layer homology domain-containing protein n=1 Tax=Paenibacillus sp. MMS20-IR301 TaxID=2895946 RepID=UPI0028E9A6E4|nr:S-layer homology domain-containing protein [Paenibacillus sp. MMS20-IR301]WNS43715.1 S-layer homology domain-containing protein [Paenibacillus sp. MMS20-IR301]
MRAIRYGKSKAWLSMLIITAMLCGLFPGAGPAEASPASGTVYYVDSTAGSDSNPGTSDSSPWRTLNKVNAIVFQPGDRILLKSGSEWNGQTLAPKGSGSDGKPIIIDRYGSGAKPKIKANGQYADAVTLRNQQYWEIRNLDVSNTAPVTGSFAQSLGDFRGIHVTGADAGRLEYFRISGVDVHDVSGEIAWISGTVPAVPDPGIRFKTGWDGSKKTGGIVFDTTVADPQHPLQATVFNDVIIENSTVKNTSFGGIIFKQYAGDGGGDSSGIVSTGWGTRDSETDPKFTPHTNIIIRGNYITQKDTAFGCNAMYLTGVRGAVVEDNVVEGAGTSGIETYYADDITIQYNEVFKTSQKAGGADSNGIDPDKGTTKMLIQYNYVHDNGDGILICQFSFGDTIIRYNVLESNTRYPIYLHSDKKAVAEIYNNTIYNDTSGYMIYGYGTSLNATYNIRNNILYTARAVQELTVSPTITYDNNSYYSTTGTLTPPAGDLHALTSNPLLSDPGKGVSGSEAAGPALSGLGSVYQLKPESVLINRGVNILEGAASGLKDFAGQPLYNGNADLGAFEYYDASMDTATVAGRVTNSAGKGMSGVALSDLSGSGLHSVTDSSGYYVIKDAAAGSSMNLKAVKTGYSDSETGSFTVTAGNVITRDLRLTSNAATGAVTGKVLDGRLAAAAGVTVTLMYDGIPVQSAESDFDGLYSFPAVEVGENYTVSAAKEGYRTAAASAIQVEPALTTAVTDLYVVSKQAELLSASGFNDLVTDAKPGEPWTVTTNGGNVGAAELPSAADKSIKLTRSSNSGNTSMSQSFAAGSLKGVVTLTADVMKLDNAGSTNWISVPYIYSSAGTAGTNVGVSLAFSKGQIVAYKGGTSTNLMPYEPGRWYSLRLVMNTGSSRFDLYVDDVQVAEQAAFRNKIPDIGRIDYYANSSNYGTAYIDNVQLYQGIPYERNDAAITGVTADLGPLLKQGEDYSLEVPYFMDAVQLTVAADSPNISSLTVNGLPAVSGVPADKIILEEGINTIPVAVTAEDGVTQQTVNVTIHRTPAALDSTLRDLQIKGSKGEALPVSPAFAYDQDSYAVTVPASVYGLKVLPFAGAPGTEIRVNGIVVESGATSGEILLKESSSEIAVTTASADGTDYRTYLITVNWEGTYIPVEPEPGIKDAAVSPLSAVFDKNPAKREAVEIGVERNGNTLLAIRNGEAALSEADYSVTGSVYSIEPSYLMQQALGKLTLVFDFNQGKDAPVDIQIVDTAEPGTDPGTNPGTDPGTNPGTDPGTNPGTDPGTDPGTNPGTDPGANPGNDPVPGAAAAVTGSSVAVQPAVTVSGGKLTANSQSPAGAVTAKVTVTQEALKQALTLAAAEGDNGKRVTLTVNPAEGAEAYEVSLPAAALGAAAQGQTLEIQTAFATVVLPAGMLDAGQAVQGDTVILKISTADIAAQSAGITKANGGRPAVDLSLSSGGKELSWQNSSAQVEVSIPYKLTATELLNAEFLAVWHIDGQGTSHPVTGGRYSPDTAAVTFKVRHFSSYAVVLNRKSFADLGAAHWASRPVEVLAAKGILNGVSDRAFAPGAAVSRADYALMLLRAFGLESSGATVSAPGFSDVLPGSYYYEGVIAAQALGIVSGNTDGSFTPGAPVTRQEMIVMTDRALALAGAGSSSAAGSGTALTSAAGAASGVTAADIRDLGDVAGYAAEAVNRMLAAGWVQGIGRMIHPADTASRAEAAVLLYNIYSGQ